LKRNVIDPPLYKLVFTESSKDLQRNFDIYCNYSFDKFLKISLETFVEKIVSSMIKTFFPDSKYTNITKLCNDLSEFIVEQHLGKCYFYRRAGKTFLKFHNNIDYVGNLFFEKLLDKILSKSEFYLIHKTNQNNSICMVIR